MGQQDLPQQGRPSGSAKAEIGLSSGQVGGTVSKSALLRLKTAFDSFYSSEKERMLADKEFISNLDFGSLASAVRAPRDNLVGLVESEIDTIVNKLGAL